MTRLDRAQIRRGQHGLDTTVKSSTGLGRLFAPTWDMVMGHKQKRVSDAEYTAQYLRILDRVPASAWDQLAAQPIQTVLCYCSDLAPFCHTHLLIAYAVEHWPDRFSDGRRRTHAD